MLNTILTLDGYRVTVCDNGDESIKLAEEERPDVIALDVVMPDKSGIEVMKEIRDSQAIKHIPILFLSAVGDQSVVVEGLKGADELDRYHGPFSGLLPGRGLDQLGLHHLRAGAESQPDADRRDRHLYDSFGAVTSAADHVTGELEADNQRERRGARHRPVGPGPRLAVHCR